MHEAVAAIASCGASPAVRIAANEAWRVKSMSLPTSPHSYPPSSSSYHHHHSTNTILGALDAGAHGICVPLLYTADDARRLVSSAKFPPLGTRCFGSPFPTGTFNNESPAPYPQTHPQPTNTSNRTCTHPLANPYLQGRSRRACPRRRRPADRALSTWGTILGARSSTAARQREAHRDLLRIWRAGVQVC